MKKKLKAGMFVLLVLAWVSTVNSVIYAPVNYAKYMESARKNYEKELYADSLEDFQKALQYTPDSIEAQLGIAQIYLDMDDRSKYVKQCELICDKDAGNEEIVSMLMEYYIDNNKIKEAAQKIVKMYENNSDNKAVEKYYYKLRGSYEQKYCAYDYISTIVDGYASYASDGAYGIINRNGEVVVKNTVDMSGIFYDKSDMAPMVMDGKAYYVDEDGYKVKVPDEEYSYLGILSSSKIVACLNGKYGYVNKDMEAVTEFEWDDATAIVNKLGAVKKNGKWSIINNKIEQVTDYIYEDIIYDENRICSNNGLIWGMRDGKYCLINSDGEEITGNIFDDARPFLSDEPAAVKKGLKWGFIDENGEIVIDYVYNDALSFRNGMAPAAGDMWGYIDLDGQFVIEETFRAATPFDEGGNAAVKIEDFWTIINLYAF